MTQNTTGATSSIFEDGKLKPGIYKIQNIETENYLDIEVHTRKVCCRPARDLGEGRGLWEISCLGAGVAVQFVEPGKPYQFCGMVEKLGDGPLAVTAYPVAWRVAVVDDPKHLGFEYVRFYWTTTNWTWTPDRASKENGAKVWPWIDDKHLPQYIWKLIPAEVETSLKRTPSRSSSVTLGSSSLPSRDGDTEQSSTHARHVRETEHGEFGTTVIEVTTITTRKKYRVGEA